MFSQACVKHSVHMGWGGGGGREWQDRRPLQRTVRILLECILVLSDILILLTWNIRGTTNPTSSYTLRNYAEFLCKLFAVPTSLFPKDTFYIYRKTSFN